MLKQEDIERMRAAIQDSVVLAIETDHGECIAVDETGKEYGHKWREGETRIYVEPDDEEEEEIGLDYVFAVRVELVAVEHE